MIKRTIIALILLAVLTSLTASWQIQIPTIGQSVNQAEDNWALPPLSQATQLQKTYIKLRKLNPWGSDTKTTSRRAKKTKTKAPKKPRPDWRFAGVVQQGQQRYILILDKNNKATQYHIKSKLPNGARLVRIHNDFIEVLQDGKLKTIALYPY